MIEKGGVKGLAHITGGGFTDNIPRVFPDGLGAVIHTDAWELPPLFKWIQQVMNEERIINRTITFILLECLIVFWFIV